MHLLMASFRALPLDLMMPLSRRRILWIFFLLSYFCPPFLKNVFLCSFSLTFSVQTRYLSTIVSLGTFAHAHVAAFAGSKWRKKSLGLLREPAAGSDEGGGGGGGRRQEQQPNQTTPLLCTN